MKRRHQRHAVVLVPGAAQAGDARLGAQQRPRDPGQLARQCHNDRVAMRSALADYLGVEGPQMPYLPTQDMEESEWLLLK